MKKLLINFICTMLIFCMVLPTVSFAAPGSTTSGTAAIDMLSGLSLLPEGYNINSKISREKFIVFLIDVMGLGNAKSEKAIPFSDITPDSEIYSALCTAYDLGIVNGNGSAFMPKEAVTYNQALKMLVSALGYGVIADAKGGYPYGYASVAASVGLSDGVDAEGDSALKGSDVALLMYNALGSPVMQMASVGDGSVTYSDTSGKTMLEAYHGIARIEGQLRATSYHVLSGSYELDSDQVMIDDVLYKTNGKNFASYAGYTVYAYYSKYDSKIIAMEKVPGMNKALVIKADSITGFANGVLSYEDGTKEKTVTVNADADITYNGRPVVSATAELFDLSDGDIIFIDAKNDGTYSTILISDFVNYVVSAVDATSKVISDLYDSSKILRIGEYDEIFTDDFGNTMYYEELKKYDVISVWQSTDGINTRMRYSNKEIKGTVTEKNDADGGYFVVDGEVLKLSKSFYNTAKDIKLGTKGIFALDVSGKIAAFKPGDDTNEYAYLIQAGVGGGAFDNSFMIRVVTPEEKIIILNCDVDRLKIDGYTKTPTEAKAYLGRSQLIRYSTNADGEVVMIDTAAPGTGDEDLLTVMHTAYNSDYTPNSDNRLRYSKGAKLFSGKVAVEADTPIFNVPHPDKVEDDNNYYINYCDIYSSASYGTFEAYNSKDGSFFADVLIRYNLSGGGASIETKTPVTVVDEIRAVTDANGNDTYKLSCYYNGSNYREYLFEDENMLRNIKDSNGQTHTLTKGDIVRLNVNDNTGIIKRIDLIYDRVGKALSGGAVIGTDEYFVSERFVKGYVYEKEDDFISLTQEENLAPDTALNDTQKEIHILYSGKVLMYDSSVRGGTLTKASVADVLDYKSFGSSRSEVVIFSVDGGDNSIVVIYK